MKRTYAVAVERRTQEVYFVEANNSTEAGIVAASRIADPDNGPDKRTELSFRVHAARPVIPEPTDPDAN